MCRESQCGGVVAARPSHPVPRARAGCTPHLAPPPSHKQKSHLSLRRMDRPLGAERSRMTRRRRKAAPPVAHRSRVFGHVVCVGRVARGHSGAPRSLVVWLGGEDGAALYRGEKSKKHEQKKHTTDKSGGRKQRKRRSDPKRARSGLSSSKAFASCRSVGCRERAKRESALCRVAHRASQHTTSPAA